MLNKKEIVRCSGNNRGNGSKCGRASVNSKYLRDGERLCDIHCSEESAKLIWEMRKEKRKESRCDSIKNGVRCRYKAVVANGGSMFCSPCYSKIRNGGGLDVLADVASKEMESTDSFWRRLEILMEERKRDKETITRLRGKLDAHKKIKKKLVASGLGARDADHYRETVDLILNT